MECGFQPEIRMMAGENEQIRAAFYRLAEEYLPDCDYKRVRELEKEYSACYLAALVNNEVIGVAFGWSRRLSDASDATLCLQGIAVTEKWKKNGIGSGLLKEFCAKAVELGCQGVSVGSAGGYVERFYINRGFHPVCYKAYDARGIYVEKVYADMNDYETYRRVNTDGFVVLYNNGVQDMD